MDVSAGPGSCYYLHRGNSPFPRPQEPHGDNGSRPRSLPARLERRRGLRLQAQEGPERVHRARDVGDEERARVDAELPPPRPQALRAQADGALVRHADAEPRLRRHLLLHQADRRAGGQVGGPARRHQEHLREARDPRGGAQVPVGCDRAVRERSRLPPQPRGPRGAGHPLLRHGHRGARVPRDRPEVVRQDHPAQRQQVRRPELGRVVGRLVHLRPAGREGGHAAAGLLPDQRREHGPVRADADHRRRGLAGALHRGLLGPGVLDRLAALGRGRAGGAARARASPTRRSRTGRPTSTTW